MTYRPHDRTAQRLARWRQLASNGTTRANIAADLGMTLRTLDRIVCRARAAGHPDAIYHPLAVLPGHGTSRTALARRRAKETR